MRRKQIVIAGGGVAALEALLALRAMVGQLADITILTPQREFVYRPVTVAEAFDRGEARSYDISEIAADAGATVISDELTEVDCDAQLAITAGGAGLHFDALVVAIGARFVDPLPGALVFRGRPDVPALRELLAELADGRARSVVLALPSDRMWPLPLYELALMIAGHLRERGEGDVNVSIVTPEENPLELFGPEAQRLVEPLLHARGVAVRTSSLPAYLDGQTLVLAGGERIEAGRVITLPTFKGPSLKGLPHDSRGFIPIDAFGRVSGRRHIYAAGDVTAFPLKQGGLAAQQADAAAAWIAGGLGVEVDPEQFRPILRGLLITGGAPLYLRWEPQRISLAADLSIDTSTLLGSHGTSAASTQALWWPPAKIAGRYLAQHLATARPRPLGSQTLTDRDEVPGVATTAAEHDDARELALLLAEGDARSGDYAAALTALQSAEALQGALAPEYEAKRREWLTAALSQSSKGGTDV